MKRVIGTSDEAWEQQLEARKRIAEERMAQADSFFGQSAISHAARIWYGNTDLDSLCLAENRLHRGEKP